MISIFCVSKNYLVNKILYIILLNILYEYVNIQIYKTFKNFKQTDSTSLNTFIIHVEMLVTKFFFNMV